jgi:Glycosyltransferase family 10 (fucosyltransferase) C-term
MHQTVGMVFIGDRGTYRRVVPEFPFVTGKSRFAESNPVDDDWLAMTLPNAHRFTTYVPKDRRILILGEPSPMHTISAEYTNQFGILISPYTINGFRGHWFPSHPGLPWLFGFQQESGHLATFNELVQMPVPDKTPELSVVVSSKTFHDGHRKRLRFLEHLTQKLGPRLHVFGRGIREVDDKAEAILPYAYHLSLENSVELNYWSEKLSDAFLGYSFPLYVGCPNITDWFAPDSFKRLDLECVDEAVAETVRFLDEDNYSDHLASIRKARQSILFEQTVFNVIGRAIKMFPSETQRLSRPEEILPIRKNLSSRIARKMHRLFHRATFRKQIKHS